MAIERQTDKDMEMEVMDEEASKTEEFQLKERAEIKILTKEKDEATGGVSSQLELQFRSQKKHEARLYRLFTGFCLLMRLASSSSKGMECYWKIPVYIIIGVLGITGYLFSRYNVSKLYLISIRIGQAGDLMIPKPRQCLEVEAFTGSVSSYVSLFLVSLFWFVANRFLVVYKQEE